jgi:hypothetical protein
VWIWKARRAACRAPRLSGSKRHSNGDSGSTQLFFPDGIAFDGKRFVRTGVTAPAFSYMREIRTENEGLVDQTGIEPVTS